MVRREINGYLGLEVLTAVVMKSIAFWDITLCIPLKVNRRFGGTYRFHLQIRINRAIATLVSLFGLINPEDGGNMFFRNVG
jgi:hypothetical protein